MKNLLATGLFLLTLTTNAQETKYLFATATAVIDGQKHVIISPMFSDNSEGNHYHDTYKMNVTNQLTDQIKIEHSKTWFNYKTKRGWVFDSRAEAIKQRQKLIGDYKTDNWMVHYIVTMPYIKVDEE